MPDLQLPPFWKFGLKIRESIGDELFKAKRAKFAKPLLLCNGHCILFLFSILEGSDIRANIAGVGAEGSEDFEDTVEVADSDDELGQIMERAWAFLFIKQLHKKYQVMMQFIGKGS